MDISILALVGRLEKYKAPVCLFIHNFKVPFDNNQAERDIRMIKVKTKVSSCFRSEDGARDYLKIMSYVGTAHKQGHNAYDAIRKAFFEMYKLYYSDASDSEINEEIEKIIKKVYCLM